MRYAVIDVSSSSISLLVAQTGEKYIELFTDREALSILHYAEEGKLSERGIEKISAGISRLKGVAANYGVEKCYVISTASVRNFTNYEEVENELKCCEDVNLNLLSGEEEAYCDYIANKDSLRFSKGRVVLIDIGGGSIELCNLSANEEDGAVTFLNFGSVQLKRKFVSRTHPNVDEAEKIKKYVKKKLALKGFLKQGKFYSALLVGATCRAVYEMYCDYYDLNACENVTVEYEKLKAMRNFLVSSSGRSLLIVKIAPERIDTIVTSVIALCAVLKYYGIESANVSPCGVKEGYLKLVAEGKKSGLTTPLRSLNSEERGEEENTDDVNGRE